MNQPYVYIASSWRNPIYPTLISELKNHNIPHYDFRHAGAAFDWDDVDPTWNSHAEKRNTYTMRQMDSLLEHPAAVKGFKSDALALYQASALLLVLPCGRSAHLELGVAIGLSRPTAILAMRAEEPELMYKLVDFRFNAIHAAVRWCEYALDPKVA